MTMANGFAKQDHVNTGELTSHLVRTFNCWLAGGCVGSLICFTTPLSPPLPTLQVTRVQVEN